MWRPLHLFRVNCYHGNKLYFGNFKFQSTQFTVKIFLRYDRVSYNYCIFETFDEILKKYYGILFITIIKH